MSSTMQLITRICSSKGGAGDTGFFVAATFVVGTLGGEKSLHSSTPPAPRPSAMLRGCLCSVFVFDVTTVVAKV